jgi:Flp pilus assembly protein TadG
MNPALRSGLKDTEGLAAVEFAIILSTFLMILLGIVEFGYDWYMKQALTNASRDAARYATMYHADSSGNRIAPSAISGPTIKEVVDSSLTGSLPAGTWSVPTPTGAGYSSTTPTGLPVTVTVTGTKAWSALGGLLPSLNLCSMTITVQTTMLCE